MSFDVGKRVPAKGQRYTGKRLCSKCGNTFHRRPRVLGLR